MYCLQLVMKENREFELIAITVITNAVYYLNKLRKGFDRTREVCVSLWFRLMAPI